MLTGLMVEEQDESQDMENETGNICSIDDASEAQFPFAMLVHDLKMPLASIGIGCEALLRHPENFNPTQRDILKQMQLSAHHMLQIANNLMDIGRIDHSIEAMQIHPVSAREIIAGALSVVMPAIDLRRITVKTHIPQDFLCLADPLRMRQILVNILDNAAKFSPEGSTIQIEGYVNEALRQGQITIRDEGPGIPACKHENIFQPYVRLKKTADVDGAGLGLALDWAWRWRAPLRAPCMASLRCKAKAAPARRLR